MRSKRRDEKAAGAQSEGETAGDAQEPVAGSALALRPHRRKLALAGAGVAAVAVALLASLMARRSRD